MVSGSHNIVIKRPRKGNNPLSYYHKFAGIFLLPLDFCDPTP